MDSRKFTIPSILHISITNHNISGLAALPVLSPIKVVRTIRSPISRITVNMTNSFLLISFLLEVGRLRRLVLAIKFSFALKLVLVLKLVGLEVLLLYQVGTRISLNNSSTCVFCSRLFFHMTRHNEIRNIKLLSLMFQRSRIIPPRRR